MYQYRTESSTQNRKIKLAGSQPKLGLLDIYNQSLGLLRGSLVKNLISALDQTTVFHLMHGWDGKPYFIEELYLDLFIITL